MKKSTKNKKNDSEKSKQKPLAEMEQAFHAMSNNEVDSFIIHDNDGNTRIFTMESAEKPYRDLVENMLEGAITLTEKGLILYCNYFFSVMVKMNLENIIGTYIFEYFSEKQSSLIRDMLRSKHKHHHKHEFNLLDKKGDSTSVYISCSPLSTENMKSFSMIITDISEIKRISQALTESETLFNEYAENSKDVFWRTTPKMDKIIYVSPAFESLWGISIKKLNKNPRIWLDSVISKDKDMVKNVFLEQIKRNAPTIVIEYRIVRPDESLRYLYVRAFQLKNAKGVVTGILGITADITEQKEAETNTKVLNSISRLIQKNDNIEHIMSELAEILGQDLGWSIAASYLLDEDMNKLKRVFYWIDADIESTISPDETTVLPFSLSRPNASLFYSGKPICTFDLSHYKQLIDAKNIAKHNFKNLLLIPIISQNEIYGIIILLNTDKIKISEPVLKMLETVSKQLGEFIQYKHTRAEIANMTRHDMLTGFLNLSAFEDEINRSLNIIKPNLSAFYMFDIDRIDKINAVMGHDSSDNLMQSIALRLRETVMTKDTFAATIGMHRFILANLNVNNIKEVISFANKILSVFKNPFLVSGINIIVNINIGIALYPKDGNNSKSLLKNADIALFIAKREGRNDMKFCTPDLPHIVSEELAMEVALRHALTNNEFCLHYQPQINIKTDEISALEALIRWKHPSKGLLLPDHFLPLAEKVGLMPPIGLWVFREICKDIKNGWKGHSSFPYPIAVNFSSSEFEQSDDFAYSLETIIDEFDIDPNMIEIEITENLLLQNTKKNLETLARLKEIGFRVALDDFGTGFSSLSYLDRVPANKIKIDKSFINDLPDNTTNTLIVKSIIALSHILGKVVLAEGVETEKQISFLRKEGCDEVQGHYFSCAQPINDLKKIISNNKIKSIFTR